MRPLELRATAHEKSPDNTAVCGSNIWRQSTVKHDIRMILATISYVLSANVVCNWIMLAEKRSSENHTSEQAVKALKRAGITVDSCVTESANPATSSAKQNVADEELVSNTLQQIEHLLNGLAEKAPEGKSRNAHPQVATGLEVQSRPALVAVVCMRQSYSKHDILLILTPLWG